MAEEGEFTKKLLLVALLIERLFVGGVSVAKNRLQPLFSSSTLVFVSWLAVVLQSVWL